MRQVQDHPRWGSAELSHVSVGRILKRLLETKFPGVVERVEGVLRFVGKHGAATWMEAAFVEFTATLHHRLAGLGPVFVRDIGEIAELARRCRDFAGRFDEEQRQGPVADVVARHVHNSEVWASGQIILQRGGCFYSRLWAGTGVTVESGVFRGEAATVSRGHVTMDEAGSPWGTEVRITILEDGVFKARRVHPGVHVVIGGAGCVFRMGARGVVVRPAGRELEVTAASWAEAGPGAGKRPGEGRRGAAAGTTAADPA